MTTHVWVVEARLRSTRTGRWLLWKPAKAGPLLTRKKARYAIKVRQAAFDRAQYRIRKYTRESKP